MRRVFLLGFIALSSILNAQEVEDRNSVIMPVFPGCEGAGNNQSRQICFSEKFSVAINDNIEKKDLDKFYSDLKMDKVYIVFQYTLSEEGKIGEVSLLNAKKGGKEYELFKRVREAIFLINKNYQIQPVKVGENSGKIVLVQPFTYQVGNTVNGGNSQTNKKS